ncbi:MAG TPA: hypothetical protein VGF45_24345 [Polyangia bacterium]
MTDASASAAAQAAPQAASPPRASRRALIIGSIALAVLVVAGAGLWLWKRGQNDFPTYTLETPSLGDPLTLLVGGSIELLLKPAETVKPPVSAAGFWARGDEVRQWHAVTAVSSDGHVSMQGSVDAPFGGVEGELVFVVARASQAPKPADCRSPNCQLIRRSIRFIRPTVPAN